MNLFCKQLYAFACVAEDNRLRNFELVEQRGQTVQLLFFFEVRVKLSQSFQGEFVSWLNVHWLCYVLLLKSFDFLRISGTEQSDLWVRHNVDDLLHNFREVL